MTRHAKPDAPARSVTIRAYPDRLAAFDHEAEKRRITRTQWIVEACEAYLNKTKEKP